MNAPHSKGARRSKSSKRLSAKRKPKTSAALPGANRPEAAELDRVDSQPLQPGSSSLAGHGLTCRDLATMHPDALGDAAYLHLSDKMSLGQELLDAASLAPVSLHEQMRPRDALERMALMQILLAHGRVAWHTKQLTAQTDAQSLGIISEACERASGTFVRLMRAFAEYRRPPTSGTTVAIGQANLANQQMVQNIQKGGAPRQKHDEQTRKGAAVNAETVSANAPRTEVAPANLSRTG